MPDPAPVILQDPHRSLAAWIDTHFDEQVAFLREVVRVPTDTPPGDNAPHADRVAMLLGGMGLEAERHAVRDAEVHAAGLTSITNLIVRRRFAPGPVIALNAHGDVVPPGGGWTVPPYEGVIADGHMFGRGVAVSKSDFATYVFALRALEALGRPLHGTVELHFTYDEEFGGALGPGWLLAHGLTRPDLAICAGFSYDVLTAHNGCLQLEVVVHGVAAHAAQPQTGVDALQAAIDIMRMLYATGTGPPGLRSQVAGIDAPTINIGRIEGGTHTNVVPDRVAFRLDRRMIPEEDPSRVEAALRASIERAAAACKGVHIEVRRLLLARALVPLPGHERLAAALQRHAQTVFGESIRTRGGPLYTDARLYAEAGVPTVLYGAGPRTLIESNAKRADERLVLEDLRRATQVVASTLFDLLNGT